MTPWKRMPAGLGADERRLVAGMRALKDRSGLGLAALASRTGFAKSSWERYLNGKQLPPPEAVRELAAVCGVDPDRLLALRLLAAEAREAREAGEAGQDGEAGRTAGRPDADGADGGDGADDAGAPEPGPEGAGRRPPTRVLLLVGCAVVLSAVVALLLVRGLPGDGKDAAAGPSGRVAASPYVFERGRTYACEVRREDERLYAGHSDTMTALLEQIGTSWDVVEAQCLLNHHGYDVGAVDGVYGQGTEKAVKRLQDDAGLVVDGVVGEHTWEVLRR